MSMKLMRKYSKPLMAFFGVLLMITFLVGYTFTSGLGSRETGFILGSLNGKSITTGDLTQAAIDLRILRYLRINSIWLNHKSGNRAALQFYLLLFEARRNGFQASPDQIRSDLKDKNLLAAVQSLAGSTQYAMPAVIQALEDMDTVNNMVDFLAGAAMPSEPQVLHFMSRLYSTVQVQYVRLSGALPAGQGPIPSEAMINKLYQAYRNVLPWNPNSKTPPPLIDGHRYPFGFRYADRVKIEFLKLDRAQVRKSMKPTIADVQAAYNYYQSNHQEFAIVPPHSATTQAFNPKFKPWNAVKARLVEAQLNLRIDLLFRHMTDMILHLAAKPWVADTSDYDKKLNQAKWVSYKSIATRMNQEFGYQPEVGKWNHWLDAQEISSLKGIGGAVYTQSGFAAQTLGMLALKVRKLDPKPKGLALLLHLQVGREGPVLIDHRGNEYIYRVIGVEPGHAPGDIKKIKKNVIQDARRLLTFEADVTRGREIAIQAKYRPLATIAKGFGLSVFNPRAFGELQFVTDPSTGMPMLTPTQVSTMSRPLPEFTRAAFDLALKAQAAERTAKNVQTKAHLSLHPATSVAVDRRLEVFTLALVKSNPISSTILSGEGLRQAVMQNLLRDQAGRFVRPWLGLKAVEARVGFEPSKH